MNNDLNKALKKYFKEIKKKLNCKSYLKQGFIAQFKETLNEYLDSHADKELTMETIYKRFGTPDVIAKSFDDIEDLSALREKSKKYLVSQIISCIIIVVMCVVIIFLLVIISDLFANSDHYATINKNL